MNLEKISKSAKHLLETKKGYRNEGRSAGVYPINEIFEYETNQLEKEDIFDTCKTLYGNLDPHSIIKQHFHDEEVWGIWLGRREDILEHYGEDTETELSVYRIPNDAIILSDLGEEGVLFAFKEYPNDLFMDYEWVLHTKSLNQKMLESLKGKTDNYIEHYGDYIDNYIISPFEHIDAWMIRDKLETYKEIMEEKQKEKLKQFDHILYRNAIKMHDYLLSAYNFEHSKNIPLEKWWWHLDKIKEGKLNVTL